jgi:cystathionine beta-lyase
MRLPETLQDFASPRHRSLKWDAHPGSIGAWIAESDFGTDPLIVAALRDAVDSHFFTYLPASVAHAAEAACAGFYARKYGWDVDPDDVHLVSDVLAALVLTIRHFTKPGSAVIVPTPSYMPFLSVPVVEGREVIEVPMVRDGSEWRFDLEGIDRAFASGAGLLLLCNPYNPLGTVAEPAELLALSAVVERHSGRVFSDEIHAPIVYPGRTHVPYASLSSETAGHTITAIATSKGWNIPGLKAAQVILSNDRDRDYWRARDLVPSQSGSILGAVAARVAYDEGGPWLDATLERFRANRDTVASAITASGLPIGYRVPDATYLAWLDLRAFDLAGRGTAAFLKEECDLIVGDGPACGRAGIGAVRFNFAMPPAVLTETLARVTRALAGVPLLGHPLPIEAR